MKIFEAQKVLKEKLQSLYNPHEASIITDWALEDITKYKRTERLIHKESELTNSQNDLLINYTNQLLSHRPVQYVLGHTYFAGLRFFVNESVLIPRPETEELVNWINETINPFSQNISLLDVGTGSGIIPISLKNKFPSINAEALDVSEKALNVAKKNAKQNNASIQFHHINFLDENNWNKLNSYNLIVSNPPYVRQKEKAQINKNVLLFEPHTALFVADDEPLLFYKKIAQFAQRHLQNDGYLFFEINETFGSDACNLLHEFNFQNIQLRKDLQGKDRMVKCILKK